MASGYWLLSLVQSLVAFGHHTWHLSTGHVLVSPTQQSHRGQQGPVPCLEEVPLSSQGSFRAPDHLLPAWADSVPVLPWARGGRCFAVCLGWERQAV